MANMWHLGPYHLDFGQQGLAPGVASSTVWYGWRPEPRDFTVTVTAHPEAREANTDRPAPNILQLSNTSVQYVPSETGDGTETVKIYATFTNAGQAAIRRARVCLTFVVP
jgi:hypothetical protein